MALTYGFYNSVEGDRKYDAIQMGQIFDGIITDGVYATFLKAMVVKASENASEVIVQPGRCWFNHTWTYIDADYPVEAPTPEVILDRVDALVIDINTENAFRANSLVWVQGTPSSLNPERPALIKSVTHNQYPLAYVYRKAGTTMIYAADITNAVGTSETPFVTGVLTGINIDDLLAQWDDEFHTWEAATKTSFEAWMVNQQSVYVTWFDSIKDQMEGDLTDFEAWFETIRGIIDEEAATHLQAEIDALSEMLPAGSHIDISTSESTLFNRNVTVSDGVHSKTVQFDASGAATVESFPYIGIISVTSTDGTRTAEESINIPYFGRYSAVLAFWSATVNLVGDETLAALPVTVRDSNGDVIAVVTLNASGQGVFTATKPDTYKFIYTYGGQTMEVSLAVTQETTYEVEIHGGFNYQAWLTTGRVSKSFSSLDEILEDEPTLRQLFLVHDSVDYICNTFSESATSAVEDITKIFNTDLAAKWINLSDYALDHFYAVAGIKSIMDTADKYGYGEWCLMPQVPNMASNTSPYGTAFAASVASSSYFAYFAFDGVLTSARGWVPAEGSTVSNSIVGYKFTNPVCVKRAVITTLGMGDVPNATFSIQGSNDNSNWTDLITGVSVNRTTDILATEVNISNNDYYLYYRLVASTALNPSQGNSLKIVELQFYAWAPKGIVPVMTSNTAPYGEASASTAYSADYGAYRAFNGDDNSQSKYWSSTNGSASNQWLRYKFVNPVNVKRLYICSQNIADPNKGPKDCKLQYSNDGTNWTDVATFTNPKTDTRNYQDTPNNIYALYWRVFFINNHGDSQYMYVTNMQFYGRELKASVPKMTSNTAPYGEAFGYDLYSNSYQYYYPFDGNESANEWYPTNGNMTGKYVGYSYTNPTKNYCFRLRYKNKLYPTVFKIQGSKDKITWADLTDNITIPAASDFNVHEYDFGIIDQNIDSYTHYRLYVVSGTATANGEGLRVVTLQFYSLDYSEKEFEVGTTKKWLYDHGVELETLEEISTGANQYHTDGYIEKGDSGIKVFASSVNYGGWLVGSQEDLTNYTILRARMGNALLHSSMASLYLDIRQSKSASTGIAQKGYAVGNQELPSNLNLDVSSINQTVYVFVGTENNQGGSSNRLWTEFTEWWLE